MSNRIRLLIVIGQLEIGGTEQHLARILPKLVLQGYDVTVFVFRGGGNLQKVLEDGKVQVIDARLRGPIIIKFLMLSAKYIRALWATRPVITHYYLPEAYLIGALLSVFGPSSIKVMSRRSLNAYQKKRIVAGWVERRLHRGMNLIFANSEAIRSQLVEEGVRKEKVELNYNGVPLFDLPTTERQEVRSAWRLPESTVVFLIVANLIPYKGYVDLLHALANLPPCESDWHLVSIGKDMGILRVLKEQARKLKISSKVSWEGRKENIQRALVAADIAVLYSHEEGFSNFILEAMSAKLPLVVSNVGGNAEAVVDSITGYVVQSRSPESLAEKLHVLLENPELRIQMGDAGYSRVKSQFNLETCIANYHQAYLKLIANNLEKTQNS